MQITYFDQDFVTKTAIDRGTKQLLPYASDIASVGQQLDVSRHEYALFHAGTAEIQAVTEQVARLATKTKHVLVIGIGGSSLGLEAVYQAVPAKRALTVLDTTTAPNITTALEALAPYKKVEQIAVCIISKSGGTTETMVNASVVLEALQKHFGPALADRVFCVGDASTPFFEHAKRKKYHTFAMPKSVGGRYSVATEVGIVPLTLLGYDTDTFIAGVLDANEVSFIEVVAESAVRLSLYIKKGFRHYNFFAFEPRLAKLGAWYRQLQAESLGKDTDRAGKSFRQGMVPTISTAVELHSIGQLYLSGFAGVYTDFVTFDDDTVDFSIRKQGLAATWAGFTAQEIATAIYGGVIQAYQAKQLPYRTTVFDEDVLYSLGMFMAARMRETMYVADLLNLDAFDQPHVELYKQKTKTILGL